MGAENDQLDEHVASDEQTASGASSDGEFIKFSWRENFIGIFTLNFF